MGNKIKWGPFNKYHKKLGIENWKGAHLRFRRSINDKSRQLMKKIKQKLVKGVFSIKSKEGIPKTVASGAIP